MADIFEKIIPLPLPRPEMEELVPGRVERQITDLHDIWSEKTKAGLELMKEQLAGLADKWNELMNFNPLTINIYDFTEKLISFGTWLFILSTVGALVILTYEGTSYLYRKFRK